MTDNNFTKNDITAIILHEFEIFPVDGRKSFYGKCRVIETEQVLYLQSYATLVCCWDKKRKVFNKLWGDYSLTTMNHVNSFMRYLGLSLGGKKWWNSMECNTNYTISDLLNI